MPKVTSKGKTQDTNQCRIAINLWDFDRIPEQLRYKVLSGKLNLKKEAIIRVDKSRQDETAIGFICDDLTAALACDIIRSEQRRLNEPPARIYILRRSWSRLPGNAILTQLDEEGKAILDPDLFRIEEEPMELIPPPIETDIFGKE